MRKRLVAIMMACVALMLCLTGCSEASKIDEEIANLGEVTLESYETLNDINQRYNALPPEDQAKVENHIALDEANKRMAEILYAELAAELEVAKYHAGSFFAQYYDTSALNSDIELAQAALDESDSESYHKYLVSLEEEVAAFNAFIEAEKAKSFSLETNDGECPFAVEESEIVYGIAADPAVKHSSDYPYLVNFDEGDTTDEPTELIFYIKGDEVCAYAVEVTQTDTIWIDVEMPDGTMSKAFVNTELVLSNAPTNWGQNNSLYPLGEGSCYLFQTEIGLVLAMKDVVSGNGYLMYAFGW